MRSLTPLAAGARVALVAPAGPLRLPADLDRATANARELGWEPVVGEHARDREAYFAGSDANRLADFNRALADDSIDAVWCLRGGYGAMRFLPDVDYAALRRRPKPVIGYSDITALHSAINRCADVESIHGPTARGKLTPFSTRSLRAALTDGTDSAGAAPDATTLIPGRARGRLTGGNLAILAALNGTPYQPDYTNAIVVLEDVNEAPYRIERMLLTLRLSGALQHCAAIVFGSFTNTGETEDASLGGTRTVHEVLAECARAANVPTICGAPVGHISDQWTLPLGRMATLDADAKTLTVDGTRGGASA
jgi:muramoyltetrapeptide carboxypeptidase